MGTRELCLCRSKYKKRDRAPSELSPNFANSTFSHFLFIMLYSWQGTKMFSVTLLVVSCGILAAAYPYSQQYGNYDQQYSQQSQYYPSSGQQGYRGGYQSNPGMQGGYQGNGQDSYQDFQGYQGYQRGQGGQRGYQGYQSNQRSQGSYPERYDSSMYSPVMDLTNYYGSQGTPQYYGSVLSFCPPVATLGT